MPIRIVSAEEIAAENAAIDAEPMPHSASWALEHTLGMWPDLSFTTPDGRRFCLGAGSDSVLLRIEAAGCGLTDKQSEWLADRHGFIVEIDTEESTVAFDDEDSLRAAWWQLHELFGVALTEADYEYFDCWPVDDDSD